MNDDHICYSTILNAWVTGGGTGTSEWEKAKVFEHRSEAHMFCQRHVHHDGTLGMFPVPLNLIKALANDQRRF